MKASTPNTPVRPRVRRLFPLAAFLIMLTAASSSAPTQSIGLRPAAAFYSGAVGFEMMTEARFYPPILENGPGTFTVSGLLGYSVVSVEKSQTHGFIPAVGAGYEIPVGVPNAYVAPGLILGVEISQFSNATVDGKVAPLLLPYAEAGYHFDFGLSVGLQTGLKTLIYTGKEGASERSIIVGPVAYYSLGQ